MLLPSKLVRTEAYDPSVRIISSPGDGTGWFAFMNFREPQNSARVSINGLEHISRRFALLIVVRAMKNQLQVEISYA